MCDKHGIVILEMDIGDIENIFIEFEDKATRRA